MSTPELRREIETQVRAVNELQTRVVSACWAKCLPKPRDPLLTVGELSCLDRCTSKYLEAQSIVRTVLEAEKKTQIDYP